MTNSRSLVVSGDYPPTTMAFAQKTFLKNNILVGSDPAQIRFLSQLLHLPATRLNQITDETLLGHTGLLLQVTADHCIDLSIDERNHTGIWDAGPILKGSAAAHAIVRHAVTLIGHKGKLPRESLEYVTSAITRKGIFDIRAALSHAAWMLTGDITPSPRWLDPWKDPIHWLEPGTDPELRLNSLYKTLVAWSLLATGEPGGANHLHVTPAYQAYLKTLMLNKDLVYESIKQLSVWRQKGTNPYCCALRIASIWS
jgi:hypothetical protein